jgi:transcriptional regulator with XRE-family HTH domain
MVYLFHTGERFSQTAESSVSPKRENCEKEISMNYEELIAMALKGRSVLSMSKQWGVAHGTLNRYVKGERMPDFDTALKIANEAGVDPGEAFETLAKTEQIHRSRQFKLQSGFVQIQACALLTIVALSTSLYIMSNQLWTGNNGNRSDHALVALQCRDGGGAASPTTRQ